MESSKQGLGSLLQQVAMSLARYNDELLRDHLDITMAQFKVLSIVDEQPNTQQKYIASSLSQTEASVSRQVRIMDENGLLRIASKPGDRREHVISLTPRGQRLYSRGQHLLNRYNQPLLEGLTAGQQQILHDALMSLRQRLN